MHNFISSGVFRQYVGLLSMVVTLPESITLAVDGVSKEYVVAHKIELRNYIPGDSAASLEVTSYAIAGVDPDQAVDEELTSIDAEKAWSTEGVFWVGAPKRIYKDSNPMADKRWGGFSWCGNTERDLIFPAFTLEHGPLCIMKFSLRTLDMLNPAVSVKNTKPIINVGSVDEAGTFTPAPATAYAAPTLVRSESYPKAVAG